MSKVRTRMAPSPTGEYHIGHIRTLLYNLAFARKNKGNFILRIEDTDRQRYVESSEESILEVIKDYGLDWDEGPKVGGPYKPYKQSERLPIYHEYAEKLIASGKAYYCFCTEERLTKLRDEQRKKGIAATRYDGLCSTLDKKEAKERVEKGEKHVVRLSVPKNKELVFEDMILGKVTVNSSDIDEQILIKSDGYPTYHMGVVVDDYLMKITHVMRGSDWIPSTPKHVLLYEAFGWEKPHWAHLPNLKELGQTKKLSKRFGPVSAREFLDQGYLPDAVLNFLMFLGWNPGTQKELYTLDEFIQDFTIERVQKTDLISFDRNKLDWMNGEYIRMSKNSILADKIYSFFNGKYTKEFIALSMPLIKDRIKNIKEFADYCEFLIQDPKVDKDNFGKAHKSHIKSALEVILAMKNFTQEQLNTLLMQEIAKQGFKVGAFFMDMRIALSGKRITPPINESMIILGKDEVVKRLKKVLT